MTIAFEDRLSTFHFLITVSRPDSRSDNRDPLLKLIAHPSRVRGVDVPRDAATDKSVHDSVLGELSKVLEDIGISVVCNDVCVLLNSRFESVEVHVSTSMVCIRRQRERTLG